MNIRNKAGLDIQFCFDPKTQLIVKQEYGSKHFVTGKDALVGCYPSKYKKINGVLVPLHLEVRYDGKQVITASFESVEFDKVDATLV